MLLTTVRSHLRPPALGSNTLVPVPVCARLLPDTLLLHQRPAVQHCSDVGLWRSRYGSPSTRRSVTLKG